MLFSHNIAAAQTQTAHRTAADRQHVFGIAGMLSYPYGDFNTDYDQGFGLHAMLEYTVGMKAVGGGSWSGLRGGWYF
jgi:hypothetical protein